MDLRASQRRWGWESTVCRFRGAIGPAIRPAWNRWHLHGIQLARTEFRRRLRNKSCLIWPVSVGLSRRWWWCKWLQQPDAKPSSRHLRASGESGGVENGPRADLARVRRQNGHNCANGSRQCQWKWAVDPHVIAGFGQKAILGRRQHSSEHSLDAAWTNQQSERKQEGIKLCRARLFWQTTGGSRLRHKSKLVFFEHFAREFRRSLKANKGG